jgi:uncharacterized protein YeeX (DUF496 family)
MVSDLCMLKSIFYYKTGQIKIYQNDIDNNQYQLKVLDNNKNYINMNMSIDEISRLKAVLGLIKE